MSKIIRIILITLICSINTAVAQNVMSFATVSEAGQDMVLFKKEVFPVGKVFFVRFVEAKQDESDEVNRQDLIFLDDCIHSIKLLLEDDLSLLLKLEISDENEYCKPGEYLFPVKDRLDISEIYNIRMQFVEFFGQVVNVE